MCKIQVLRRLNGLTEWLRLKSYSHGAVAALLHVADKLDIPATINQYIKSPRQYTTEKPLRNNLTTGITLLLGAIGRVCMPTSKRGWWNWAKTTTIEYLIRCSLCKIDSRHYWDLMDTLPIESISEIESKLLERAFSLYGLKSDTLLYDTTNFFTYIDTTNQHSSLAQRGKNKQKRYDLRQIGLAMVVTREDMIPLFHLTYQGNMADTAVFSTVIGKIKKRMEELGLDIQRQTIVFDRGNNSKKNAELIKKLQLHYVGALTPYQNKALVEEAMDKFQEIEIDGSAIRFYRTRRIVWQEERTVVVFISDQLKAGQIRGVHQCLNKTEEQLKQLQNELRNPKAKKRQREHLESKVAGLTKGQFMMGIIDWSLEEKSEGKFELTFLVNQKQLSEIEESLGLRILMTDRHDWDTADIMKAYHVQSTIELAFRNLKNPYHLALKPQFHWTDQKIVVHFFICVLGYLLATIVWQQAKAQGQFKGTLDTLLDTLNNVRLASMLEENTTRGRVKAMYKVEEVSDVENLLMVALEITPS